MTKLKDLRVSILCHDGKTADEMNEEFDDVGRRVMRR